MSLPETHRTTSRRELRKALVRLRLEMHRQEIRHETLVLTQPLRRAKGIASGWQQQLGTLPHAPLWGIAGVAALGFFAARSGNLTRLLRLGTTLLPLLGGAWRRSDVKPPSTTKV
ncbi:MULTISPECIES: hypothetical protein [Pseudomonas]|uniref:YqjK-like protein n=1 Tax=Pseudomonas tohonis TaxID=2725477 RepID=A0A6J4E2J0_9PSED|nr:MULTISPECIES: hypothetical protein [Pseudomonas]UXY54563.1 hypothetical protein N9L84_08335 [Pseudomonas tohonis]BBP82037.1 hypothetical protein PHLH8_16790 [Pseudomonas sp. Pc102]BCG23579.1 hypothetical protein TUM18999_17700 [Pseudomonas tohonis]GJN51623.1 hypothetical protein TUM20286_13750 [Pseudomonas tohonis]